MPKVKELLDDISYLPKEDKHYIYNELRKEILLESELSTMLDNYRGIAENIWNEDVQNYIDKLRINDRV